MSVKARLRRAERGNVRKKDIYIDRYQQEDLIIRDIRFSLSEARSGSIHWDAMPETIREWESLCKMKIFKDEANPQFLLSFDAFIQEFGTCTNPGYHLRLVKKHYTTWTKYTCEWRKHVNPRR